MSLSAQFQKSQQEQQAATRAAGIAALDAAAAALAVTFPDAVSGVAARALKGKGPNWFQRRQIKKSADNLKNLSWTDLLPAFFEAQPGFCRLRDACAAPEMDIALQVYVTESSSPTVTFTVDPTQPFSASCYSLPDETATGYDPWDEGWPMPNKSIAIAPPPAPPAPPPAPTSGKIAVLPVLKLKR